MKSKIIIQEDTISTYLSELRALLSDETNSKNFIGDAGYELHFRQIEPRMPEWNPNLKYSPLEKEHQIFKRNKGKNTLELIYTGFTEFEEMGLEKVFSEFAVGGDPHSGHLARDYAYFQETGIDPEVNSKEYTPSHTHFVKRGTADYVTEFHYKTMAYVEQLLHLNRWERQSYHIHLWDYAE